MQHRVCKAKRNDELGFWSVALRRVGEEELKIVLTENSGGNRS